MALLFSHVRVSTPDGNEAEFLVSGIPREFDDFEYYTAFEDFLDGIEEDTEISVHAEHRKEFARTLSHRHTYQVVEHG